MIDTLLGKKWIIFLSYFSVLFLTSSINHKLRRRRNLEQKCENERYNLWLKNVGIIVGYMNLFMAIPQIILGVLYQDFAHMTFYKILLNSLQLITAYCSGVLLFYKLFNFKKNHVIPFVARIENDQKSNY